MNHVESDSVNAVAKWRLSARILAIFVVFIMVSTAFAAFLASAEDTPGIWTSKDEYSPGETVEIYGGGFVKWVPVSIAITHPDLATQTFVATPDMYGRFICIDYVAEIVNSYNVSVTVTATQILEGGNRVAITHFWDPAAFLEGWTLMPHQRFTTGDVKGYNEDDSVPMIVVLNKKQIHANAVTMSIGVDFIDTTPLHVPTYGIDYLTQYWTNPPAAPFNTLANSSSPFFVAGSSGALSGVHRDSNIYDAGRHITEQVWTFTFTFSPTASLATIRFGAHLAVSDVPNGIYGASYYPGESLHVRIVAMDPDVNNGNRDVPISLGQALGPPKMDLEKECDPEVVIEGDIITFTIHFSNVGQGDATCVNLWDVLPGPGVVSLIPGSFLYWDTYDPTPMQPIPGPTITSDGWTWFIGQVSGTGSLSSPRPINDMYLSFQVEVVTSQEGTYTNWVHMTYEDGHGGTFPQLDAYCEFYILGYPSISIVKSGPAYAHVGDVVTYTYTVTNTGNVDLVSVDVVDNVAGNVQLGFSLLAHQSVTLTKTYTIQPGDSHFLTNIVTATGTDTHGRIVTASSHWTLEILRPHIVITKTSDWSCAKVGESVWYTISWSNPPEWETTLYNVTVNDPMLMVTPINVGTLPPGAGGQVSIRYTVTDQWGDPQINTATANGEDRIHGPATSSASVRIDVVHPDVEITKTASLPCAAPGEMVIYTITVTNPSTADVWLNGTYGDTQLGQSWTFQNLRPGQSLQQVVAMPMPSMDEFINEAWVRAEDHQFHVVSDRASVRVDVVNPSLEVTKTADKTCAAVDETVQFTITVKNTGDVWLNGTVSDPMISSSWSFTNLRPGQTIVLVAFYAMPAGMDDLINTATVVAYDHQRHQITLSASVRVDIVHPEVEITKTASLPCAGVGEDVTFTITVTNPATADVWLNGTVSDPKLQQTWSFSNLMPGHSFVQSVTMPMPAGMDDFVNTATVDAFDHQNHEVRGSASVRVDIVHPEVIITKTASLPCAGVGEDVTFTITVTNPATADVWLNGTVEDPMLARSWSFFDLMPGQTFQRIVTIPMPAGMDDFVNTATVDAFDHQKHEVTGSASVRVDIVHPDVTVTKTADKACAAVDELVLFTITVTNPGSQDVWLNGTVSDPMIGGSWTFTNLRPGQQFIINAPYPMPQGPTDFINIASVRATDHQGHVVAAESVPLRIDITHGAVEITKTASLPCAGVGEDVTFTITVTNPATTDVWLNGTVEDPMLARSWSFFDLMPGQTFQRIVTIPMPAGMDDFVNTATVDAFDHQKHEFTGSASVRVDIVHGSIQITKVSDKQCAAPEEMVTYLITVTNPATSDVWLNGTYGDRQLGVSWSFQNLMPGQSLQQSVQVAMPDVDAFFNDAWVVAYDHQRHEKTGSASIRVDVVHPDITITKTANRVWAHDGDLITYTITVGVPLTADVWMNGTVTDTRLGFSASFFNLQPGQSISWFPTLLVTPQTEEVIDNVATVVAADHQDHQVSKRDSWTVTVLRPDIHVTKIGPVYANVGDLITYFVNVTNTGNCDLFNVLVHDSLVGDILPIIPVLLEGATVHLTYQYQMPAGGANVDNTVTASGADQLGLIVTDYASWTVMKYSKILGIKAADLNRNGARDQGEPGLKNWEIVLTGVLLNGTPIRPQVAFTDDFGYYEFTNLTAGSYQVSEVMQPGWHNYSPQSYSFSLGSGMSMARDFLNMPSGSISGSKFEDLNLNGRWDLGEPGVAGWIVYLTGIDANNAVVSISTTTDAAGHYSFTGLIPGMYYVSEESRAGWFPTTPSPLPVDVSALDPFVITDQNFGNARYGSITGNKWLDLNMDGIQDGAEPNLPGWTIVLDGYQADGTHVHLVTVTDACGNYAFLNLKPGVYTVTEELQGGWINITPLSREITIIEGSDVTCGKFGNVPFGSIAGWKFYDWDLDQMKDGNEPGIPGWHITLTGVLTNGRPVGPITIQTDANGVWSFDNLLPGSYCVTEEQIAGWHNTTPIQLHLDITPFWQLDQWGHVIFVGVTHVRDVKFGNVPLTCITGTKYNDLNGNGQRDPNEPGIAGWGIDVYGGPNNDHQVLTDQDGNYEVCGLLPGIYLVSEESRRGWMHTTPPEYGIDLSSPRAPASYAFVFGNFELGKITGSKWQDMNGNGILDAGDQPIQGWTIYLDKVGGGTISTTTDVNGNYEFDNLMVGQYTVREENRADWVHMNQASYGVTIISGTTEQLPAFLNVHLSTVTGCKFDDLNGNGIRDPNEPGIAGWTIYMIWDRDPTVYQAITDERGCYQFTGLMPDTFYEVYESQRPDWTPTNQTWEEFSIVSGTTHRVHDFGNFHNAKINVFKYEDRYSRGYYEAGDTPLPGWHFIVTGPGIPGGSAEIVTDISGWAQLTVTAAGLYTVTEVGQAGWVATTPTVGSVILTSGSEWVFTFGNFKCVDITLFKYEDVNSDGVYEQGLDNPIGGWTFYLTSVHGGELTVVTESDGFAHLHFCSADVWFVREEERDGWIPVNPDDGRLVFVITSGRAQLAPTGVDQYEYDFGNFHLVHICVFKFWDKCSDGVYTAGFDVPLGGWLIQLYDEDGNLVDFGYTNRDGRLCFVVDKAGTYTVKEEDRAGWSHIEPKSGSWTIYVVSGDEVPLEFANYEDVKIPIFKYEDRNCNGIYDQGDTPVSGWYFELVRTGDGWTFSGVTDGNGMLTIIVNRSGIYRLTEEARPDWTPVNPASGKVLITLTSGTIVPLQMFGNFHNVLIPVFKFSDADGDGYYSQAAGDSPLEGWHFYLWKEVSPGNWVIVNTNVTDVHGHTEFIVTDCGHYRITEESRAGWFWISPLDGQYTFWICSGKVFEVPFCFANFKLGTITVYKFNDLNGNGRLDQGEPGLPGWTIELQSQGQFFWYDSKTTDANGFCEFTGLPPGWFTVWEDGQAGWIPTSPSSVSVLVMGNTHAQVYFLNFHKGCIEGYKYNDVNGNGVYDAGVDIPIEDWEITLAITTGVVGDPPISAIAIIGTTHTDENGHYEFCDLGPGIYVVSEEQKQPWVPMTPTSEQVVMTSGATIRIHDFLNYAPGSICGFKYEDVNCNGVYDPGIDRPIEGWMISMIEDALPEVHVTYTNSDGYWCFDNLRADYYLVWEESRDHWTAKSQGWAEVTITSGMDYQVDPFLNFHNVSIPIFKYDDVNGDGIYEQGTDVPLQGWSFTVTGPGVPGGSMTVLTGPDGWASVEVNCSGTYAVSEAHVTGWKNTTPDSLSVTVQSGDVLDPLRFGNFQLGRLFGIKSYDWNVNGSRDASELGLGDWEIVLTGTLVNGTPIRPQVVLTDDNGFYEFTDLLAGSYVVSEIVKPGWVPTSPPSVPFGVFSGTDKGVIFNNALYGIVEGYKFYDKNMNGVRDGNEPGLAGWVIHLDGATDHGIPVHMVTTTDSNGHYAFTVQPGHYLVTEELLGSEWQATTPSPQVVETSGAMETFDVTVNIGNVRFATIWGYKFLDTYCQNYPFWPNGVFDLNEVGIGNWRITLQGYTDTGVHVDLVQFTDNDPLGDTGHYAFTQVLPGTYWINETRQFGWVSTTPYSVLMQVYAFPAGPVVIRRDFGNLLPSADPTMPFLLQKGWNLWSSPLTVTGLTAKGLLSAIGANGMAVTRLDESQGRYFSYVKGYNDSYDFPITLGDGYYVYVKQKTQFTLTGEFEQSSSAHVLKGWNIVGYTKLQPMKASVLLASLTGCHAKAVTYLDAATGIYHSYVKGYPAAFDFTVTQGRSYFLWVDGAGTLTL